MTSGDATVSFVPSREKLKKDKDNRAKGTKIQKIETQGTKNIGIKGQKRTKETKIQGQKRQKYRDKNEHADISNYIY